MYRKSKSIEWRNRQIHADFCAHRQNNMPTMLIYATLGYRYDLSEQRIREIVMEKEKSKNST